MIESIHEIEPFIKLNAYDFLVSNNIVYVKVDNRFIKSIKEKILQKYGSLRQYNLQKLKICYGTLKYNFGISRYFKLMRLLKIAQDVSLSKEEVFDHIFAFFATGSHTSRELILQKKLIVDENFVEGYSLYLAEGDSGLNGSTKPRKVRFTNSELSVVRYFIEWIRRHFPGNYFYLNIIYPRTDAPIPRLIESIKNYLEITDDQIRIKKGYYNKRLKYRVCLDQAILIDLILSLEETIKKACIHSKELATSYIRGMMAGEGTVYFNKSRYVRIEMKNEREIKYLTGLFKLLSYEYKVSLRSTRKNMWSIYVGAKQLRKFYNGIGFGSHKKRQAVLEMAANKKLRVNQYI
ncbi:LAGLIDADG family homing endonuclease [Patescibacteria group bacterium]|nr:LAGLIDADG family homing endonuclease [Patescibacteria group bacterium]